MKRTSVSFRLFQSQAALAIENSLLLDEQERLMEGIVNACITAIEARDPIDVRSQPARFQLFDRTCQRREPNRLGSAGKRPFHLLAAP